MAENRTALSRGLTLPLQCKRGEVGDDLCQLLGQQVQGITHEDQLGIISDVTARGAVVNDAGRCRGRSAEGVNVLPGG